MNAVYNLFSTIGYEKEAQILQKQVFTNVTAIRISNLLQLKYSQHVNSSVHS
jgi:hypothetical protein